MRGQKRRHGRSAGGRSGKGAGRDGQDDGDRGSGSADGAGGRRLWTVGVVLVFIAVIGVTVLVGLPLGDRRKPTLAERYSGPKVKNVLIFLVDTLRADHLGCYGYQRRTSPNVDGFAAESVLFRRGFSVSPWTRTSVVSMFTSLYPAAHGCQDKEDSAADELVMLAEAFQSNGYRTAGFSSNISVSEKFNLDQGFETFTYFARDPWFAKHPGRRDPGYFPIEGMIPDVLDWLTGVGDRRFFLYFHNTDPHFRYAPPGEFALWGQDKPHDRYDGEIRYTDYYFGRLIDHLKTLNKLDETLVIFTADHGEEWREHGRGGHGHTLYNELLEVPLIVRHPYFRPQKRTEIVRLIDLFPSLVQLCGLDVPTDHFQGRTLVPLLAGEPDRRPEEHFVFSEVMYPRKIEGIAYQADGWKVIWTWQDKIGKRDAWELYRVETDPREQSDLASAYPSRVTSLADRMADVRETCEAVRVEAVKSEMDPETRKQLKSLGYVE